MLLAVRGLLVLATPLQPMLAISGSLFVSQMLIGQGLFRYQPVKKKLNLKAILPDKKPRHIRQPSSNFHPKPLLNRNQLSSAVPWQL